jgi:hypothetical protein
MHQPLDFRLVLSASAGEQIASLDPLRVDALFGALPRWNAHADVGAMVRALASITPTPAAAAALGPYAACAAMRDVGMLLSSLRRHGVQACEAVPALTPALLTMAETCGMIPRDTVYHYGPWNPVGERQRCFTDDSNEAGLIHCVRSAAPGVEKAIDDLHAATDADPTEPDFSEYCRDAAGAVASMVESITFARHHVDVTFFAKVLRPYFEAVDVDGRSYMGPAAAHLPLSIVDHLTWGSDCTDPTYREFQEDAAKYTVLRWRELIEATAGQPSLVTRVVAALDDEPTAPAASLLDAATALHSVLRVLLTFRGRHKVLAEKAYRPEVRLYPVGSGGYTTDVVARILGITLEYDAALRAAAGRAFGVGLQESSASRPESSRMAHSAG